MTNNPDAVRVGKPKISGGFYSGATDAVLPVDATDALDVSLTALGYVSDEGVTQTIESDTESITAWGGDEVRTVRTTHSVSYALTLIETTEETLAEVYGSDNVSVVGSLTTVHVVSEELPRKAFVFDMQDGDHDIRIVLPNAQAMLDGDVTYTDGEALGYPLTITAYPDEDGVKAYIYVEETVSS